MMKLNRDQQKAFDAIEQTNYNYFITGKPGVGKSVLINELVEWGGKKYTLCAPTGLAALNIKGKTLHSTFRLPISQGILQHDYNIFPADDRVVKNIKYNVNHLIIDEISMVRADMLDYIDRLMRHIKNPALPFGGCQVIVVGDFFQLPPVAMASDKKQLIDAGYNSQFAFSSNVFETANFKTLYLSKVERQKNDSEFLDLLHSARTAELTIKQCGILNKGVSKRNDLRIALCGTNKQAEAINLKKLQELPSPPFYSSAVEYGSWPAYPTEKELHLKVGAQIMIKANGADKAAGDNESESKVVNGSLAVIKEINVNPKTLRSEVEGIAVTQIDTPHILVTLENGDDVKIFWKRWELKIKEKTTGEWEEKTVASYEQWPIALAWAISIHKSQGQSFDKVHIDATRIFEDGQLYVAISRCRSLKGLQFAAPLNTSKFRANKKVIEFYNNLK